MQPIPSATTNLGVTVLDLVRQHIPPGYDWAPVLGAALLGGLGILLLAKGAKLAPALAALTFAAVGGGGGMLLAPAFALPFWPVVATLAIVGAVIAVVLFRLWFALLVACCLAGAALSLYGSQTIVPALERYQARGLVERAGDLPQVTLPVAEAGAAAVAAATWEAEAGRIWEHLRTEVPNLQVSLAAIVGAAGIAGFIFALLLPHTARALWAASTGVALFLPAAFVVLSAFSREATSWLGGHVLIIAAIVWAASLLHNWADLKGRYRRRPAPAPAEEAAVEA